MVDEAIEGSGGSPTESPNSETSVEETIESTVRQAKEQGEREPVQREPVNPEPSSYSHDESTASKMAHSTHEDWVKPRKHEEEPATETPRAKPFGGESSGISSLAHDEDWKQERTTASKTTPLPSGYPRRKNVTEIPEPEPAKSTWRSNDPRTEGTPIKSPMFTEQKKESLFTKITEAPRRAKERAEEMGYSAQQKYHAAREVPAETAAKERYESRMSENDIKFQKGEISSTIHKRRQLEYATEYDKEKKPLEQRMVNTSMHVGNAFIAGLQHTQQKVADEYRSSPAPKIKPSRGLDMSRVESIGVRPTRVTTHKGKRSEPAPKYQIDFGRSGSTIDFSGGYGLFGRAESKKKKR